MSKSKSYQQSTSFSKRKKRDIIFMANGSTSATKSAYRGGSLIGFESLNTKPIPDIPIDFVDYPFKKVQRKETMTCEDAFEKHLNVVREINPKYAVIPDIDETVSAEQAYSWAYSLDQFCETLIVAPKAVHPSAVPDWIRVGIPCQDKFAHCPWEIDDYRECDEVHLFGGSPHLHHEILYERGLDNVESMDTSVPVTSARWGDAWGIVDGEPKWIETRGGMYGCLEQSFYNMCRYLNVDRSGCTEKRRYIERPDRGKYKTCGYPDDDLLHPDDKRPFAGREYYTEMTYNSYPDD